CSRLSQSCPINSSRSGGDSRAISSRVMISMVSRILNRQLESNAIPAASSRKPHFRPLQKTQSQPSFVDSKRLHQKTLDTFPYNPNHMEHRKPLTEAQLAANRANAQKS